MGKQFEQKKEGKNNRGRRGSGRGGRGGRPKPDWNQPPESVCEVGYVMHPCEEFILVKNTLEDKVPIFGRPVYIENKKKIGMIEDVLGPINEFMFSVKCDEGIKPTSFKENTKIYMNVEHFLSFDRFLPKKPTPKGQKGKGQERKGGARGGRNGRGKNNGGYRPPRGGNSSGGYRPPRGGNSNGGYRPPRKNGP